jgi:hypothetical protein
MFIGVATVGTLMGQLVFDYFRDKLGRKRVYDIMLVLNGRVILQAYSFKETSKIARAFARLDGQTNQL